jgi:hypothetical protein
MKKLNVLMQAAVAAGVLSMSHAAMAAVTLGDGTAQARTYASERVVNGVTLTDTNLDVVTPVGFGTSAGATRYVRFDLTNAKFKVAVAATQITMSNAAGSAASVTVASGGATTDSYVIAQMTSPAVGGLAAADNVAFGLGTAGGIVVTSVGADASIAYSLYDTAADAVNGTATGRLSNQTESIAKFGAGLKYTVTTGTNTAIVANEFKKFTGAVVDAPLGSVTLGVNASFTAAGVSVTLGDLVAAGTKLTVAGDFSAANSATSGGVYLGSAAGCTVSIAGTLNAGKTSANINVDANAQAAINVCYTVTGATVVPVLDTTVALTVTAAAGSTAASVAAQALGNIKHDGTTMVAPLAQVPAGWISRLVLSNHGTTSRTYTVTAISESGNTVTLTGAAASGTLASGTTTVVDLAGLLTATGAARSSLKVIVSGPQSEIDGLYQIVNSTSGSVSNHVLAYK